MWDFVISKMKIHPDVMSNPSLMQLYHVLYQLFQTLESSILITDNDLSQDKVVLLREQEKSFSEIIQMLNPLLKKKVFKEKLFELEFVQKLMSIIRSILVQKLKKEKQKKAVKSSKHNVTSNKKRKRESSTSSSSSSSSNSSSSSSSSSSSKSSELDLSSDDNDDVSDFESLFPNDRKTNCKDLVISQRFQIVKNGKTKGFTTPGETGSHLIKIEISDTSDLKGVDTNNYWKHVGKKGLFLLNLQDEHDKELYENLNKILVDVGKRVKRIENIKPIAFETKKSLKKKPERKYFRSSKKSKSKKSKK